MPAATWEIKSVGVPELDQALSDLGTKAEVRLVTRRPARRAMQPVRSDLKLRSRRTHPRSMQRDPTGGVLTRAGKRPSNPNSRIGPMARFVSIRSISPRSALIGARLFYDTKKFPGFVVQGKKTGKRAFYPASQEYGAKANPPIKKKGQMAAAARAQEARALTIFRNEFKVDYEKRARVILRRSRVYRGPAAY